jgi:hypothetical protein
MILREIAGLDPHDRTPEAQDASVIAAVQFRRAGGTLTLADWSEFDALERAAMMQAGLILTVEDAIRQAIAHRGDAGLAEVAAEIDGGAARDQLAVTASATHQEAGP